MQKLIFLVLLGATAIATKDEHSLKSISVVFRHGDRTPEQYPHGFYPNDPYKNCTFDPVGHSRLTNKGKRRAYQVGTSLRNRYDEFLGDTYRHSEVSVTSSDVDRTKTSLLLLLASLYPPKKGQIWSEDVNWQPIPINSIPDEVSSFFYPITCPKYAKELDRVMHSEEYKTDVSRFDELKMNLTVLIGREVDNVEIIYHLYHTLTAEAAMDLPLPEWTKPYFPNGAIINATIFQYETESYNKELKKLNGGLFVRRILNDWGIYSNRDLENISAKPLEEHDSRNSSKIYLYSSHENSLGGLLKMLDVYKDDIPPYSSAIIFELYEKGSRKYIRIIYYKSIPPEFETRVIPGCSEYCLVEDFLRIFEDVIPDDILDACFGSAEESEIIPSNTNLVKWLYAILKKWFNL